MPTETKSEIVKLRCVRKRPFNGSNRKIDRFEVVSAPTYVGLHIFGRSNVIKDWDVIKDLLTSGHSIEIENRLDSVTLMEYQASGMSGDKE